MNTYRKIADGFKTKLGLSVGYYIVAIVVGWIIGEYVYNHTNRPDSIDKVILYWILPSLIPPLFLLLIAFIIKRTEGYSKQK